MIEFEKPNYKITDYVESNFYGKFEIEPLERGFGTTLGNALRRVMLSSLPGSAISSVKIEGALHEFQTVEGVVEDVTTIILNLKKIVVKNHSNDMKTIRINVNQEGPVTAGDIDHDSDIEILNPELVIANVAKGGSLVMEMTVSNGRGYVDANEDCTTNAKGIFVAGDCRTKTIRQVITAAGDGAVASLAACDYVDNLADII